MTPDLASIPSGTKFHGHIYVLRYSSNHVKVGKAIDPRVRIQTHAREAGRYGMELVDLWVSPPHANYDQNERALIDFVAHEHAVASGREYFVPGSFTSAVTFAAGLPFATFSPEEVERLALEQEGSAERAKLTAAEVANQLAKAADYLQKLVAARDRAQAHEDAARDERQQIYALIVARPEGVTKAEIHRASGVSRPTIDSLLKTGRATR